MRIIGYFVIKLNPVSLIKSDISTHIRMKIDLLGRDQVIECKRLHLTIIESWSNQSIDWTKWEPNQVQFRNQINRIGFIQMSGRLIHTETIRTRPSNWRQMATIWNWHQIAIHWIWRQFRIGSLQFGAKLNPFSFAAPLSPRSHSAGGS